MHFAGSGPVPKECAKIAEMQQSEMLFEKFPAQIVEIKFDSFDNNNNNNIVNNNSVNSML